MDSKKKIVSVIPVSPDEPYGVIEHSWECMRDLEVPENYKAEFYYVVDTLNAEDDERLGKLEEKEREYEEFKLMVRKPGEGKRAGAINAVVEKLEEVSYVGLFDVDSRPHENFLTTSVDKFEDNTYLVTSPREINNAEKNFVTQMVDAEFRFLTDMQRILDQSSGFNHFNGLIGLLDGEFLAEEKLNTDRICEDTDFSERAYLKGKRLKVNLESRIAEQAVTNFEDLFNQKVRWMTGALEGLRHYTGKILNGDIDFKVKTTWFFTMIMPFLSFLFSPFTPVYGLRLLFSEDKPESALESTVALFVLAWIVSISGVSAILKNVFGSGVEWKSSEREDL